MKLTNRRLYCIKKLSIAALLAIALFSSCNSNCIYKEFDKDFTSSRWPKNDVRSYSFTIPADGKYDLYVHFSHVYDSPLATVPLKMTISSPSHTDENLEVLLKLRDADGAQLADCTGDYCDLEQQVFGNRKMTAGDYVIKLANDFNFAYLPNVLGVGIEVRKSGQ